MRAARRAALVAGGKTGYDGPTEWLFTEDGVFTVPVSGTYEVEMHGGGGGGAAVGIAMRGGGGGGSGELYTLELTKDSVHGIEIGAAGTASGAYGTAGGRTVFGVCQLSGGGGGQPTGGGVASGSLASAGRVTAGGLGNVNKPEQTYGNGGNGVDDAAGTSVMMGQPGAVIVKLIS